MLILNRLSGFGISSGASAISTLILHGSSTSSSSTISVPAGTKAGDLLVLIDYGYLLSGSAPSGFTEITSIAGGDFSVMASYKIAAANETNLTGRVPGEGYAPKVLAVLRGSAPISSATAAGVQKSGPTNSNPASISVTASGGTAPLLVLGFYASEGVINPRTFSPSKDSEVGHGNSDGYIAWRFDLASGQDTTIDMDDEGSGNSLIGCYLQLSA